VAVGIIALAATCKITHQHEVNLQNLNVANIYHSCANEDYQICEISGKPWENCDDDMQILHFFKYECVNIPFFI
jgi:hypothetical protein